MSFRNFIVVLLCTLMFPGLVLALQPTSPSQQVANASIRQRYSAVAPAATDTPLPGQAGDQLPPAFFYQARRISTEKLGFLHPTGLAYTPSSQALLVTGEGLSSSWEQKTQFVQVDLLNEEATGLVELDSPIPDPLNIAFDAAANNLIAWDSANQRIVRARPGLGSWQSGQAAGLEPLGLQKVDGIASDPESGILYLLDSTRQTITAYAPNGSWLTISTRSMGKLDLRGIGYNPNNSHLYVLSPGERAIYELTTAGETVGMMDISDQHIASPQGMLFAPSGNPTDDPSIQSLYLLDGGTPVGPTGGGEGGIVELIVYEPPQTTAAITRTATLVQTILTRQPYWSIDAPDPAGLTFWPDRDALLVSDSEVEGHTLFRGKNLFLSSFSGTLLNTYTTIPTSYEPTGLAVNPANGHLFISDDDNGRVYEFNLGPDGQLNTADDIITFFRTTEFGCSDPEGIAYGDGMLFVVDGLGNQIYIIAPGDDGVFNGVNSGDDVLVRSIDTQAMGMSDPEGIDYTPLTGTLFIAGPSNRNLLIEVSLAGDLISTTNISIASPVAPAGVAVAPASNIAGNWSIYVSDRAVDLSASRNENDGKIYEFALSGMPVSTVTVTPTTDVTLTPTFTSTASVTPTHTHTATATSTPTSTPTPTHTHTFTPTSSATPTHTATATSSATPTHTFTPTSSATPTHTATFTVTPTITPTSTPTCPPSSIPGTPRPDGSYCWYPNYLPLIMKEWSSVLGMPMSVLRW